MYIKKIIKILYLKLFFNIFYKNKKNNNMKFLI